MNHSYEIHRAQIETILRAWGMSAEHAGTTADVLSYADLCGIDSHGMSMLPPYDRLRRAGLLTLAAAPTVLRRPPFPPSLMRVAGWARKVAATG